MGSKLLALGGIIAVVGYLVLLIMPVGHIPLLDANREVLVESERGGYCSGIAFVQGRGYGSPEAMADCMETSSVNDDIDYTRVQGAFCRGIIEKGLSIAQDECEQIMSERQYWPTAKGTLTDAWNRRFPYPGDTLSANRPSTGGESRTGDREGNEREEGSVR